MTPTALRTVELGATGLKISRVGFGAWAIGGGGYEWSWGPQDDEDSIAAIPVPVPGTCSVRCQVPVLAG